MYSLNYALHNMAALLLLLLLLLKTTQSQDWERTQMRPINPKTPAP